MTPADESPPSRPPMRLRVLLALVISLTVSIGVVSYAVYVAHQQSVRIEADLRREALALADSAAGSLAYAMLAFDQAEIEDRVLRYARFPGLVALRVADGRGNGIVSVETLGGSSPRLKNGVQSWRMPDIDANAPVITIIGRNLRVSQSIRLNGRALGRIEIDYSLLRLERDRDEIWRTSLTVGVLLLIVINVLLMAMLERPLRALERLTRFAAELGHKPGKTVRETAPVREVADLQSALNSASERLAQQQQAIIAASLRLQMLLDHAGDAVLVTDFQGNVSLFNPAAERLFGWSTYEAVGFTLHRLLPDLAPDVEPASRRETWGLRRDGQPLELELSISVIDEVSGPKRIFVLRDVTARKDLERQWRRAKELAETANRAKSDFLANMSHEIRTPMNGILGMTELLLDTTLSYEQRDYLFLMKSSADSLLEIINDILDFSKIEAGRLELEAVEFNPRTLTREVMHGLALRASEKRLELILDVADDVPETLIGDPLRLRQVLINLVGNAIKFTDEGEVELVMRISPSNDVPLVYFGVRDTGIGIAQESQAVIFDAFTQADSSTTRQFGGTGLGLAISYRLVSMMQGTLTVRSQAGMGSLFFFSVPLSQGRGEGAGLAPDALARLNGQTALIVDDNFTHRRILQGMTSSWGMPSKTAVDGASALALLLAWPEESPKPVILLDGHMPGMDGFEFASKLRSYPRWADALIVMLTSSPRPGDQARASQLYFSAYMIKPVEKQELAQTLLRVMAGEISIPVPSSSRFGDINTTHSLKVLAAEDNPVNQRLIVSLLQRLGHQVRVAADGQEAVHLYKHYPLDLILMDVQMPVLGGLEATHIIRSMESGTSRHTPIVAMTANAMPGDREKCLAAGMDDYLAKPLLINELVAVLSTVAGTATVYVTEELESLLLEQDFGSPHLRIDIGAAIDRLGGDKGIYRQFVEMYLEDQPRQIETLLTTFKERDVKGFERSAHSLKGLLASLGADGARESAWELEQAGRAEHWELAERIMTHLLTILENVEHDLEQWLVAD